MYCYIITKNDNDLTRACIETTNIFSLTFANCVTIQSAQNKIILYG